MKISFDTQTDSFEDIKKVMQILSGIIARKEGSISIDSSTENKAPVDTTNLMSMFGDSSSSAPAQSAVPDTPPDFSSFLNLTKNASLEKKENTPRIQLY